MTWLSCVPIEGSGGTPGPITSPAVTPSVKRLTRFRSGARATDSTEL